MKPEVMRLLQEGVALTEIKKKFPDLASSTLYKWKDICKSSSSKNNSRTIPEPPRQNSGISKNGLGLAEGNNQPLPVPEDARLPIDPETPLEKIRNALWDIVSDPEGKGVAVQALNILVKIEQLNWDMSSRFNVSEMSEEDLEKIAQS
ncbi:MAG: hypothetical protein AAF810_05335 [Cyanobacteria bacterium P01_D01_bin.36]